MYSCFDDKWRIKAPSRSTKIISFLQMFGHRTWCSFFSAAFAICFPVMSCRLAFHQYRFPYSMKATHLASLHAMFPSCFDFATLTIAGPSFVGGCYCWTLLLNVSSLIAIAKNGKEFSSKSGAYPPNQLAWHNGPRSFIEKMFAVFVWLPFAHDRQFAWLMTCGFGMSWRAIRHATVEDTIPRAD